MTPSSADPLPELSDFTRDRRVLWLSALAVAIGAIGAVVAWALLRLIGVFTNLAYFHRLSSSFASPAGHRLGW